MLENQIQPHPGGRPTKYQPAFAEQAAKLCKLGATDADLADFFGVSIRSVERWRTQHEEFCRAVTTAKEQADDNVERSLYQRAVGYTYDAVKIFQHNGEIIEAPYREHVPPDTASMIFWLKNRRKDQWRDRQDHTHEHTHAISAEFERLVRDLTKQRDAPKLVELEAIEVSDSNVSPNSRG